jgi:hypothetical protein
LVEKPVKLLFGVVLTNTEVHYLGMIEFLDAHSAFEHYKRVLGRNGPVETGAKYHGDRLHVEHYNAHTGQFIIGAIFTKSTRRDPGSFLCLLSGPVNLGEYRPTAIRPARGGGPV